MANVTIREYDAKSGNYYDVLLIDNGDGTFSRSVQATSTPAPAGSTTLYDGTKALTTTAAAIAASQAVREILVQSHPDNTADVLVGNSTSQSTRLRPGQAIVIPAANLATVFAKTVSGTATLNYMGRS